MIGATKNSATITTSPSNWNTGGHRPDRPAAVEREQRREVEQVDDEVEVREPKEQRLPRERVEPQGREPPERTEHRPGEPDARLGQGVLGHLLHRHERPEKRDEHRGRGRDALAPELQDVPHLVHPDQDHYPDREPDREEQGIRPDADEHGQRRAQELDLEKEQRQPLELCEQQPDRGERREQALDDAPQATFWPQGLILGSGLGPSRSLRKMGSLVSSPDER